MQRRDLLRGGSVALALTVAGCAGSETEDVEDSTGNGNGDDGGGNGNGNGDSDGNGGNGNGNGNGDSEERSEDESSNTDEDGGESENGGEEDADETDDSGDEEGSDDAEGEDDSEEDGGDDEEDGGDDEEAEGEASLEIVSEELSVEEGEFMTDAWVEFVVENTGDGPSGEIIASAEWYDDGGDFLGDMDERMVGLGAGETWVGRVYALTEAEDVADFELSGEFSTQAPAPAPEGLEFLEGEIQHEDDQVRFNGRVENTTGEGVDYVEANVKFYDGEGNVLGSQWTNETDLPADTTWSFDVTWLDRRRVDQVEDFEVYLADSAW